MSTKTCPKTCTQLSVSAILISIGIVQLLAGIILLKSADVSLLAGTDLVLSISNVLVGSLLGVAASVWEKKKKAVSLKNTARQNVLAGLYITVLSMNAAAAIIMILGDGNKLLMSKDSVNVSGDILFEVLACAYVTSVCSPIICLVIALVCLSSNRIRIYENMKKKNSIARKDSYGWVFENNFDGKSRNLDAVLQDSSTRNFSVSDDVFDEKSVAKKLLKTKPSKVRNSSTSLSDQQSPLEIWAHKRNKIIKEITSTKPIFFADDYLQFPDYKYDLVGTLIPRITPSSIKTSSRDNFHTANSKNADCKMTQMDKTMSCKLSKTHLNELNFKLASRRMSYPDSELHGVDENQNLIDDERKPIDEPDAQLLHTAHSSLYRTNANLTGQIETRQPKPEECFNFEAIESSRYDMMDHRSSSEWLQDPYNSRKNSNYSGLSGLTAETISELKAKINRMNTNNDENAGQESGFFQSFKHSTRKPHVSASDVEDERNVFEKLHDQYGLFIDPSEKGSKTSLAGEVVPISIPTATINRANSIPLKSLTPSRYSVTVKNEVPDQNLDTNSSDTKINISSSESLSNQRTNSLSRSIKEKSATQSDVVSVSNSTSNLHLERKSNYNRRMSTMGSIAESPTEEFLLLAQLPKSAKTDSESSNPSPEENSDWDSPKNGIKPLRDTKSLRRLSLKTAPSLLNRLWSVKKNETKTDLTSLIMDSDSLVGLSDDDLMARSRRLRQLRKSVEQRSKAEKQGDVV